MVLVNGPYVGAFPCISSSPIYKMLCKLKKLRPEQAASWGVRGDGQERAMDWLLGKDPNKDNYGRASGGLSPGGGR